MEGPRRAEREVAMGNGRWCFVEDTLVGKRVGDVEVEEDIIFPSFLLSCCTARSCCGLYSISDRNRMDAVQ